MMDSSRMERHRPGICQCGLSSGTGGRPRSEDGAPGWMIQAVDESAVGGILVPSLRAARTAVLRRSRSAGKIWCHSLGAVCDHGLWL